MVIGIIAILIAILLPTLAAARRQANLVQCGSNLRQVAQACFLHAQDHRGYMPLAGLIQLDAAAWSPETVSAGLGDLQRKRYTYSLTPKYGIGRVTVPLPAAVAPYLGMKHLDYSDWHVIDQQLNDRSGVWRSFMCPETDAMDRQRATPDPNDNSPVGQATMMVIAVGPTMAFWWSTNSDFGMNEAVFGYDHRPQYAARRLAGNLSRVRRASEVLLFADAKPSPLPDPALPRFPHPWNTLTPALDAAQPVTLADVLAGNVQVMSYRGVLDLPRHRRRMNVVFADGHVDMVHMTPAALERVYLTVK